MARRGCRFLLWPLLQLLCLTRRGALNQAPNECLDLDLFGSKTGYSEPLGRCLAVQNELFDGRSLEQRHNELTGREQCKPIALILIGRHAARQPSPEELVEMNRNLDELLGLMRFQSSGASDQFLRWRTPFDAEQADLVTKLGAQRHRELAHRLKLVYSEFFDASKTLIELATTSKIRTLQSGIEFMKEVGNFELIAGPDQQVGAACEHKRRPEDFLCGKSSDLACLAGILSHYQRIELEFHKVCKRKIKQDLRNGKAKLTKNEKTGGDVLKTIARIKKSVLNEIAGRIKQKLDLSAAPSSEAVWGAYETCVYEASAIYGSAAESVWCQLFEREDLESLEYLEDAKIFHKTVQNRDSYYIQSSPLMRNLLARLETASSESNNELRAYFGFTHDGVLKKFLAALGLFDDDKGYTLEDLRAFESTRLVPKRRPWRSSLMVPFSANVQFALYKCDRNEELTRAVTSFKLMSSVAERPVSVRGCEGSVCPLEEFLGRHRSAKSYNDEQVCQEVRRSMGV